LRSPGTTNKPINKPNKKNKQTRAHKIRNPEFHFKANTSKACPKTKVQIPFEIEGKLPFEINYRISYPGQPDNQEELVKKV